MNGKFIGFTPPLIAVQHADGLHSDRPLDPHNCEIKLDGKTATLHDLLPGDEVELSGQPATSLKATRSIAVPPPGFIRDPAIQAKLDKQEADKTKSDKAEVIQDAKDDKGVQRRHGHG